jgi:hypothetical protein
MKALPKAEQLPRFPPGTMIQSGGYAVHDALLPFEAEGVHAVHQVDAHLRDIDGDLPDAAEACVEVAFDLQRQRTVIECLRELAERNLPAADEDDPLYLGQPRKHRQARAGVAGGGARDA